MLLRFTCTVLLCLVAPVVVHSACGPTKYTPDWQSLMTRPLPSWFDKAKIGVFIHWGVFSVPSYKSEWYWWLLDGSKDPEVVAFHNKTYGAKFKYADFAPMFTAELFDPDAWAALFKKAGIRYVVLTSKHHEGFTNWCSPRSWNWNACDAGPHRDLVGDLTRSVRAAGLRMGLYHSIFEWFHPLFLEDKANGFRTRRYVDEVYFPEALEINRRYKPDLIWSDGDWNANSSVWRSPELLAWLYNEAPNCRDVLVNDRWGSDNPPIGSGRHFGGYFSGADRQQADPKLLRHKWENAFTIDAASWGYSRKSNIGDYLSVRDMLHQVISTIAYGGNALINVGPTHDGRILPVFQERLLALGKWLEVNGAAVYGSRPWRAQNDTASHGVHEGVYYTASPATGSVFAFAMHWPADSVLRLVQPKPSAGTSAQLLGCAKPVTWSAGAGGTGIDVHIPSLTPPELPSQEGPWVFELRAVN